VKETWCIPVGIVRRVRGVSPFRIPSIYTEAPDGTLSRIRMPVVCRVAIVLTGTCGFLIGDDGAVVSAGPTERALIDGSVTPPGYPGTPPAKTGTGNTRKSTSVPIRRPGSCFMVFTGGSAGYFRNSWYQAVYFSRF